MDYPSFAEKSLAGECLTREEARWVLETPDENITELLQAAWKVRFANSGRKVQIHMLINAKSGICEEDCHYCSQSSVSKAEIDEYPLLKKAEILEGADRALQSKALRYCIVTSGRGPRPADLKTILSAVREIKQKTSLSICCSLGLLTPEDARLMKDAGVDRINHNLNTSEAFHSEICTTHTYRDRVQTLSHAREAGMELCSGGILGMGEKDEDLIDAAMALREIAPESLPINFLHPIGGTAFGEYQAPSPLRCLKVLCLFRFLNPKTELRIAGGRERNLRSLQPLALLVGDSIFVDGYLTTDGQRPDEALKMIEDLGMEVEEVWSDRTPEASSAKTMHV